MSAATCGTAQTPDVALLIRATARRLASAAPSPAPAAYDFASAYHIPTYLFLSLTVAMFLGLTNSCDDIIRDRIVLQRERNLNVRLPYYIFAKTSTLALFAR